MRTLYFITSFNSPQSGRDMKCVPSSLTYNNYLIRSFEQLQDTKVKVVSSSISNKRVYWTNKSIMNGNHEEIYFSSFPKTWGKWAVRLSLLWLYAQMFFYLLFSAKKDDLIIIYHGHGLSFFYKGFKRFLHSKIYYVVGEIFSAVWDLGDDAIKTECSHLKGAEGYIFSNDIMPRLFSAVQKSVVCYGSYDYSLTPKIKSDIIHVLYAGKISTDIINDAFIALDVIKYLPDNYMMHIAGYGEEIDLIELKKRVDSINREANKTIAIYEGNLSGEEYENLLSICQIGLCTRTLRNDLSNYCFPSKTLVYLNHDILPICPRIDNLLESRIADRLEFVDGDLSPMVIAKTIEAASLKLNGYNNESIIRLLNDDFLKELKQML